MKKTFIAILAATLGSLPAVAFGSDLAKRIESLAQESMRSKPACEAYKKAVNELMPPHEEPKPLAIKVNALKLLTVVQSYPGTPTASKNAFNAAAAEYSDQGKISKDAEEALMGVYGCDLMTDLDAFRTLILSALVLQFSKLERKALVKSAFGRIIDNLNSQGSMIETMIYGSIISSLIDEKLIDVSDAIFTQSVQWGEQAALAKLKLKEAHRTSPMQIGFELQLTAPLRESLVRISKRLSER